MDEYREKYDEPDMDEVLEEIPDDNTFVIGQGYEERPAKTIRCKNCKGTDFNVGQGSYYTAIRCTTCEWQVCIHEG